MKIPATPSAPPEMESDGCTMCKLCGKLLGAERYRPVCKEHDFLRRYAVVSVLRANYILGYRLWQHGLIGKLRAPLYFLATTITWPFYRETENLPAAWEQYADLYR